jgi:hypothetical protein
MDVDFVKSFPSAYVGFAGSVGNQLGFGFWVENKRGFEGKLGIRSQYIELLGGRILP